MAITATPNFAAHSEIFKKTISLCLLLITVFSGPDSWAISWEDTIAAAQERARSDGKPVMADFYTDWCGWCKKLDSEVYSDPEVNKLAESFVCVKVNCGVDRTAASTYGLKGFPTIIFFDAAGEIRETVIGYRDARAFTGIMNRVLSAAAAPAPSTEPAAKPPGKPVVKKKLGEGEFELQGIMLPKAIVNDKIVVAGQVVNGAKVIGITSDGVKLLYQGQEITLGIFSTGIEKTADTVYFKNGRKFSGIVVKEGAVNIELETEGGIVVVSRASVKKIQYTTAEALAKLRERWGKKR